MQASHHMYLWMTHDTSANTSEQLQSKVLSSKWSPFLSLGSVHRTFYVHIFSRRLRTEKWMNVQVGDIIKLENDQFVTVSVETLQQRLKNDFCNGQGTLTVCASWRFIAYCCSMLSVIIAAA